MMSKATFPIYVKLCIDFPNLLPKYQPSQAPFSSTLLNHPYQALFSDNIIDKCISLESCKNNGPIDHVSDDNQ